jgi:hypothetical protein
VNGWVSVAVGNVVCDVIPAQAGIQIFQRVMDSRLCGSDTGVIHGNRLLFRVFLKEKSIFQ